MKKLVYRVSLGCKRLPVEATPPFAGWVVTCLSGSAVFIKPPVPLVPAVPPDPTAPVDMTTRITALQVAIKNYQDGGQLALTARNVAEEAVIEGLDALAFCVQTVSRFDRDLMLTSGFVPVSTNHGQSKLETPSITGIANDTSTELDVHLTVSANAYGYEVQICTNGTDWKTVKYSAQSRTITADRSDDPHGVSGACPRAGRQHRSKRLVDARLEHRGLTLRSATRQTLKF